jgi:hypothetical protein
MFSVEINRAMKEMRNNKLQQLKMPELTAKTQRRDFSLGVRMPRTDSQPLTPF